MQSQTSYDSDTTDSGNDIYTTTYHRNTRGDLTWTDINDGDPSDVHFTNDLQGRVIRRVETSSAADNPIEQHYRFGGKEMGFVGNNGTFNMNHGDSTADRTTTPEDDPNITGSFRHNRAYGQVQADFDNSYEAIGSYHQGSGAGGYTVRAGETLSSIAAGLYGDSGLWYKIAQANGLSADAALVEGTSLQLPAGITRNTYNAATFKPYDPGAAIGDVSPTTPEPPKQNKCGVFGQILLAVVAVAVTIATAAVLGPASTTLSAIALGAVSGAAGSVASQAVGVATGIQDKFSFKSVALAAIGGGVGAAGIGGKVAGALGATKDGVIHAAIGGAVNSAITQGIGAATGLQDSFSWAGVAAAGVGAGFGQYVDNRFGDALTGLGEVGSQTIIRSASAIANAATRSAIDGSNFGDNIIAAIPDVIGQALGSAIGAEISKPIREANVSYLREQAEFKDFGLDELEYAHYAGQELDTDWEASVKAGNTAKIEAMRDALYVRAGIVPRAYWEEQNLAWAELSSRVSESLIRVTAGNDAAKFFRHTIDTSGIEAAISNLANEPVATTVQNGVGNELGDALDFVVDGLVGVGKAVEKINSSRFARAALIGLEIVTSPLMFAVTRLPPVERLINKGMNALGNRLTSAFANSGLDVQRLGYAVGGGVALGGAILSAGKFKKVLSSGVEWIGKSRQRFLASRTALRVHQVLTPKTVKAKIHGRPQQTGNDNAHAIETWRQAVTEARKPEVHRVHLDHGYNRGLDLDPKTIQPNRRPDVLSVYNDKTVKRIEVESMTDNPRVLRTRNDSLDSQIRRAGYIPNPTEVLQPRNRNWD